MSNYKVISDISITDPHCNSGQHAQQYTSKLYSH